MVNSRTFESKAGETHTERTGYYFVATTGQCNKERTRSHFVLVIDASSRNAMLRYSDVYQELLVYTGEQNSGTSWVRWQMILRSIRIAQHQRYDIAWAGYQLALSWREQSQKSSMEDAKRAIKACRGLTSSYYDSSSHSTEVGKGSTEFSQPVLLPWSWLRRVYLPVCATPSASKTCGIGL